MVFGSSFAIVNYERDYVTMDCEGVYIHDNLFKENAGCSSAAGNTLIVCIPEKPYLSPFTHKTADDTSNLGSELWLSYYPSVNQQMSGSEQGARSPYSGDFDSFTQEVFTKFVKYVTRTKGYSNQLL